MDDCDLEKFSIKPGKLEPKFRKDLTDYKVTLLSHIEQICIDPLPRDNGASWCLVGREFSRQITLAEGEVTEINIEVTAEDGRTKKLYIVKAKRLSAKDAILTALVCDQGTMSPPFSSCHFEYSCLVPCGISEVTLKPTAPDPQNVVSLGKEGANFTVSLNSGNTSVLVSVQSVDKSNKQPYQIQFTRHWCPRFIKIKDESCSTKYECPISLSALHCPIWIKGTSPKHLYSASLIDEFTKTNKIDFLSGLLLEGDWRVEDDDCEGDMARVEACLSLTYGGYSDSLPLAKVTSLIEKCAKLPKMADLPEGFSSKAAPAGSQVKVGIKHGHRGVTGQSWYYTCSQSYPFMTRMVQSWEKNLHRIYEPKTAAQFMEQVELELALYHQCLPHSGCTISESKGEEGMGHLMQACYCCAGAIKESGRDPALHLRLGMLLEECYYAEDIYGLKSRNETTEDMPSFDTKAKESSKAEECEAICNLHGVGAGASVARKLQAVDREYHQLQDAVQGGKADHVQELYAWLSKQVMQEGATAQKATDTESPLGQAYLKYLDALTLDESKAAHSFHVGRLLVVQGNYTEAVPRLEAALSWNKKHEMSRLYLGLALALQTDGAGSRATETIGYLLDGMETLLTHLCQQAMSLDTRVICHDSLTAESLLGLTNVYVLRSLNVLGTLVQRHSPPDSMSPADIFHHAALLSSHALTYIARGNTYKQVEWVLLEAHSNLLQLLSSSAHTPRDTIRMRCQRLSSLISHTTIPKNAELLSLQLATTQRLVHIQPCSSMSLCLLAMCQYDLFDNSPGGDEDKVRLDEARLSFLASLSLEGQPVSGDPPDQLKEQKWWQKIQEEKEQAVKSSATKEAPGKPAAGRGGAPARGAAVRGRGTATTPSRGGVAGRGVARGVPVTGKPTPGRGTPATPGKSAASKPSVKTSGTKVCASSENVAKKETAISDDKKEEEHKLMGMSVPLNLKSFQTRIGLARVYGAQQNTAEAQKYYKEVIAMAPEVHDAYIEAGNILLKADPLAALDIYCLYPVSDTPTFDDAYIYGEILSILIKKELFDDPRLVVYMVAWGRTMGIGCLDKYVSILEAKGKMKVLKTIFAGLHRKPEDDPDLQAFFKFKCW